jgi:hypothetical protein
MHSVVTKKQFQERFSIFTNHVLDKWTDWKNMVVIGGAMVASLLPIPKEHMSDIAHYYHHVGTFEAE